MRAGSRLPLFAHPLQKFTRPESETHSRCTTTREGAAAAGAATAAAAAAAGAAAAAAKHAAPGERCGGHDADQHGADERQSASFAGIPDGFDGECAVGCTGPCRFSGAETGGKVSHPGDIGNLNSLAGTGGRGTRKQDVKLRLAKPP